MAAKKLPFTSVKGYVHGDEARIFIAVEVPSEHYDAIDKNDLTVEGNLKVMNIPGTNVTVL